MFAAFDREGNIHLVTKLLGNVQAETKAVRFAGKQAASLIEGVKNMFTVCAADTATLITHMTQDLSVFLFHLD